jgi:two-component system cell cycle response regulator
MTGDRVLETLGRLLLDRLPENAMAVRFGGEEFALLIPNCLAPVALARAEGLRREIETLHPADVAVTVSIGLATNQHHPELKLTQLLNHADTALYAAKAQGRNTVCD